MHCATKNACSVLCTVLRIKRAQMVHRNLKEIEMQVGRGSPAVMVRMTDEMKVWLKHQAIDNRRSLNAEILHRLEQSRKAEEAQYEKQA